jgi:hypothetical protein
MNIVEEVVLDLNEAPIEVGRTVIWKAKDGDYPLTIVGDLRSRRPALCLSGLWEHRNPA